MNQFLIIIATFVTFLEDGTNLNEKTKYIEDARLIYNSYDVCEWIKAGFDENSGGYCVYHKEHQFSSTGGGGRAEKIVGKILKNKGKQIEFLPEIKDKNSDIKFDEQTWDIKYINNANFKTIRGYIQDVLKKKSDNCIFYFTKSEVFEELRKATDMEVGKMKKLERINEMPNIYYIFETETLKLLWKK